MRMLFVMAALLPTISVSAPIILDESRVAWDYTLRSDLRGFECRAGGRVVGMSGPNARSMPIRLSVDGEQTVQCRALSSDSALTSDYLDLLVDYDQNPTVAAPTFFCRDADGVLSWTYSGTAKEFVLYKNGELIGKAGPGAATMAAPPLLSGSHVLGLTARSVDGAESAVVNITRTYPESGILCDGD